MQVRRHRHPRACHTDDMRDPHDKFDQNGRLKRLGPCYEAELPDAQPLHSGASTRDDKRVAVGIHEDLLADVSRPRRRALLPGTGTDAWSDEAPLRETQQRGSKRQHLDDVQMHSEYAPPCISQEAAGRLWSLRPYMPLASGGCPVEAEAEADAVQSTFRFNYLESMGVVAPVVEKGSLAVAALQAAVAPQGASLP